MSAKKQFSFDLEAGSFQNMMQDQSAQIEPTAVNDVGIQITVTTD